MSGVALSVRDVSWRPGRGAFLLNRVGFELEAGKVLGIAGANGAGKSTLLRLLYRYNKPVTGTVRLDGHDIWSRPARDCARKVAAVLQEQPTDFALSVREIVALGRRPHGAGFSAGGRKDTELIDAALEQMGVSAFSGRLFGSLSGGERQRVMVARALAQTPQLLILDEPTNHLDIRHQLEIVALIARLDITVVTSLHDLNLAAQVCDEVLLLHRGSQIAHGAPEEVLTPLNIEHTYSVKVLPQELSLSRDRHLSFHL